MNAEYDIAEGTLYYWRHKGIGPPSVRIGRRVMYRRGDVEAWIAEQAATERAKRVV